MKKFIRRSILLLCSCVALGIAYGPFAAAADSLKITVYGGSGRIGQRIVNEALSRGHTVIVVARDPSRVEKRERLTAIKGDVTDTAGVTKQIAGQDVVITAVSSMEDGFYSKVAQSLVSAIRSVGNKQRLLWVGGATTLALEPGGKPQVETNPSLPPFMKGQMEGLNYLRSANDVSWTVLTPPQNIEPGMRTGKYRVGQDALLKNDKGDSRISMEDFAVAMLDEVEKPQHVRARFTVAY